MEIVMKYFASVVLLLVALVSCTGGGGSEVGVGVEADTLTFHARYLTIAKRADGAVAVDVADPWHEGSRLASYLLVHRDSTIPTDIPSNVRLIRTPVSRAAVYSSVHTGAMLELDVIDALVAVADLNFFSKGDTVSALGAAEKIIDVGPTQNPSIELLAASAAEVVLRSPFQGVSAPALPPGMVAVECADFMEDSPIGRAEWLLLFGELFGMRDEARRIFDGVIDEYSALQFKASGAQSPKPKILVETEYSGVWYVPAGESYAARLYKDAGADYPWADTKGNGSLALSLEEVAAKAIDADIWLVRSFGYETTAQSLRALNQRYSAFKALKDGNIYSCDTQHRNLFNDVTYHPERLLADYIAIFHPDVMPGYQTRYFIKK